MEKKSTKIKTQLKDPTRRIDASAKRVANPTSTSRRSQVSDSKIKSEKLNLSVYNVSNKTNSLIRAPKEIFNVKASDKLLAAYNRVYNANQRQSSAQAKTRSEVVGSTRKIYRQKGTGRARHGAKSAPIFVGGGVAHGPRLHPFKLKINKKQRIKALLYSLSKQNNLNNIIIVDNYSDIIKKTKDAAVMINNLTPQSKNICFIYDPSKDLNLNLYFRNLDNLYIAPAGTLNAYQVMKADKIIFTKSGFDLLTSLRTKKK